MVVPGIEAGRGDRGGVHRSCSPYWRPLKAPLVLGGFHLILFTSSCRSVCGGSEKKLRRGTQKKCYLSPFFYDGQREARSTVIVPLEVRIAPRVVSVALLRPLRVSHYLCLLSLRRGSGGAAASGVEPQPVSVTPQLGLPGGGPLPDDTGGGDGEPPRGGPA
jgi:hypothetical protein